MGHPPYSHDPALNGIWLLPNALKGWRIQDIQDIQKMLKIALKAIPQEEFQKC
jgi:hypothetical protein